MTDYDSIFGGFDDETESLSDRYNWLCNLKPLNTCDLHSPGTEVEEADYIDREFRGFRRDYNRQLDAFNKMKMNRDDKKGLK